MKRPTQADVARVAGVSRATVSYVINDSAHGRVSLSDETQQRVRDAIQRLGYHPDVRAQSLRAGGVTHTLGLLLPDLHNPFYWKIAAGVEQEAQEAGYDLLLFSTGLNAAREEETLRALSTRQIDGLILNVTFPQRMRRALRPIVERGDPVVLLGDTIPNIDAVQAKPGYREYAQRVMAHLFELGHRRIGMIYGVVNPEMDSGRLDAYCDALRTFGLPVHKALIDRCGATLADGYQAARRLLQHTPQPTAIITINDLLAIGALRAIHEQGLSVPEQISLVGFDDIDLAAYLTPPLTTVQYDAAAVGRAAVKLLLARLDEPTRAPQVVRIPTRLILRASTGPASPGTDEIRA